MSDSQVADVASSVSKQHERKHCASMFGNKFCFELKTSDLSCKVCLQSMVSFPRRILAISFPLSLPAKSQPKRSDKKDVKKAVF